MRRLITRFVCVLSVVALANASASADAPNPPPQSRWEQAVEVMPVAGTEAAAKPGAPAAFSVPAGFAVERLFVVPKEQLGSWVCLATDPKGRHGLRKHQR